MTIENVTVIPDEMDVRNDITLITFNITGPLCFVSSVEIYLNSQVMESIPVNSSNVEFWLDDSVCYVSTAYFDLIVEGDFQENPRYYFFTVENYREYSKNVFVNTFIKLFIFKLSLKLSFPKLG